MTSTVLRSVIESWLWWVISTFTASDTTGMDVHEFSHYGRKWHGAWRRHVLLLSRNPGIYIPGKVGVRIEDCGYVTKIWFDLSLKPAKTYFTSTNPLVVSIYNKLVSLITIKMRLGQNEASNYLLICRADAVAEWVSLRRFHQLTALLNCARWDEKSNSLNDRFLSYFLFSYETDSSFILSGIFYDVFKVLFP